MQWIVSRVVIEETVGKQGGAPHFSTTSYFGQKDNEKEQSSCYECFDALEQRLVRRWLMNWN